MKGLFRGCILGPPASGKGTISGRITKTFDVIHLSTGDIFRQNISKGTPLGQSVQKYISEGKLVPDVLVTRIVFDNLKNLEGQSWLLDGFPRTLVQAEKLFMVYPLSLVINLKISSEVIISRVKGRWVHIPSGRVYNEDYSPPKVPGKDDVTGEPLVQRPDDNPEAVRERLKIYEATMGPIEEYYRKKGILREFEGNTSDEIWSSLEDTLKKHLSPRS